MCMTVNKCTRFVKHADIIFWCGELKQNTQRSSLSHVVPTGCPINPTCLWTLCSRTCEQIGAGEKRRGVRGWGFNKCPLSNWLPLKRPACSRRGYWLSCKLKYLNVEEDRCRWLCGLEATTRNTRVGGSLTLDLFTMCGSYRGAAIASSLWPRIKKKKRKEKQVKQSSSVLVESFQNVFFLTDSFIFEGGKLSVRIWPPMRKDPVRKTS